MSTRARSKGQSAGWHDYLQGQDLAQHTVSGTLKVCEQVYSPQLDNARRITVYLPPSYATGRRRYPVIYFHDGQNLFDDATSYAGEWHLDEILEALAHEGLEAIAVGVDNMGEDRVHEYSPAAGDGNRGLGDAYLSFVLQTVKPLVDSAFRTRPGREHTGLAGSSLGRLISLYGFLKHSDRVGVAAVFSPALWFGREIIFELLGQPLPPAGRMYLDVGTAEGRQQGSPDEDTAVSRRYVEHVRQVHRALVAGGYSEGDALRYVEEPGGIHHESAWARRLPDALRFLLKDRV